MSTLVATPLGLHSTRLDDPYLPLLVQGAAGLPLDPSFAGDAEHAVSTAWLIGAGLITNM